jgi:hypothetical protein
MKIAAPLFLMMLCAAYSAAETPGRCSDLADNPNICKNNPAMVCAAGTTTCTVTLARSGASATAKPNLSGATPNMRFCIRSDRTLKFQTTSANNVFEVTFSSAHKPSPQVAIPLRGSTASPVVISPPLTRDCYIYSIKVCDSPSGTCGISDPIIIVGDN